MEKKDKLILRATLLVAILALTMAGLSVGGVFQHRKIAFVRSSDLVYGYLGMKDAHQDFEQKSKVWQANVDTLQQNFQQAYSNFNTQAPSMKAEEKDQQEQLLEQQKQQLLAYTDALNKQAKTEDEKITQGVLNQINSFVTEYGQQHDYEIILGTTNGGSLLYGQDGIDITEDLLKALNENYLGEKPAATK